MRILGLLVQMVMPQDNESMRYAHCFGLFPCDVSAEGPCGCKTCGLPIAVTLCSALDWVLPSDQMPMGLGVRASAIHLSWETTQDACTI